MKKNTSKKKIRPKILVVDKNKEIHAKSLLGSQTSEVFDWWKLCGAKLSKKTLKEIRKDLFADLKEDRKPEDRLLSIIILVLRLYFDFSEKRIGAFLTRIQGQTVAQMILEEVKEIRRQKQ